MTALVERNCVHRKPDEGLDQWQIEKFHTEIPKWSFVEVDGIDHLRRSFSFKNFAQALDFTIAVGALAEEQDHHPQITTEWGKVTVEWWTHTVKGLSENDFIMAAKTDALPLAKNS